MLFCNYTVILPDSENSSPHHAHVFADNLSLSACATVSSSPVSQQIVEPALVNGQISDDTDSAKPQSKESSPSDSKSCSSEDGNTPKERSSSLSDPDAQQWIQVEKRHRNSPGKNKVLSDPSLVMYATVFCSDALNSDHYANNCFYVTALKLNIILSKKM